MNRLLLAALFVLGFFPSLSSAVDIKNIRPCYAPFGATRYDLKLLPGDVLFITYDLEGLKTDKSGKTNYETTLELIDTNNKVLYKKPTTNEVVPQLGTGRMPGDLHVIMGAQQAAGKYTVRLTVHDKLETDKNLAAKKFEYPFDVIPQSFGFVGVTAPAIGFPGQHYVTGFGLVNLAMNDKKQPNTEINIRILDEKDNAVAPAVKIELPRDMPEGIDLTQANFVPLQYPIYLNRPGRFTIDIQAKDNFGNRKASLRYPVTVLDVNSFVGK